MYEGLKESIIEALEELPAYSVNRTGIQHTVRCPYCGDSSNPNHAHFSIKIDANDDSPMVYRCLKDGVNHGILTEDVLADLGIHLNDRDHESFKAYMKKSTKYINNRRTIVQTEVYKAPLGKPTNLNRIKLAYLNQRLGLHWTFEDALNYKIVFSLSDFMQYNEIENIEAIIDNRYLWVIDNFYVGFLSANNNCIQFRYVPTIDQNRQYGRYQKVIINPRNVSQATFYSIPSRIDLLYQGELHVHVAEGTFDIISVKENLKPNYENQIFYASCGYGYMTIMRYLISNGICNNIHLHVYADKDKDDREQFRYIRSDPLNEWFDHITIHRNQFGDEKDYGVPLDHIIDGKRKIR